MLIIFLDELISRAKQFNTQRLKDSKIKASWNSGLLEIMEIRLKQTNKIFFVRDPTKQQNIINTCLKYLIKIIGIFFFDQKDQVINNKNTSLVIKLQLKKNVFFVLNSQKNFKDLALIKLDKLQELKSKLPVFIGIDQQYLKNQPKDKIQKVFISGCRNLKMPSQQDTSQSESIVSAELPLQVRIIDKIQDNYLYYKSNQMRDNQIGGPIFVQIGGKLYLIGIRTGYHKQRKSGRGIIFNHTIWKLIDQLGENLDVDLQICRKDLLKSRSTVQKFNESYQMCKLGQMKQKISVIRILVKQLYNNIVETDQHLKIQINKLHKDNKRELQQKQGLFIIQMKDKIELNGSVCSKMFQRKILEGELKQALLPLGYKLPQTIKNQESQDVLQEEIQFDQPREIVVEIGSFKFR